MISNASILTTLVQLEGQFNIAVPPMDKFLSKLALLETCGWIEEAMDDLWDTCMEYKIKSETDKEYIREKIKRNYGFGYNEHFRKILTHILGLWNIGKLEKRLDPAKFVRLTSALSDLKARRDSAAHTHIQVGTTQNFAGPSSIRNLLTNVCEGLADIEQVLVQMKLTKV